jgi:hypothetical protein
MLERFIHWLSLTRPSLFIQEVHWLIPTVQIVHILAISVLAASMGMFDLRLLGIAGTRHSIAELSTRFLPWLWTALPVLLVSGSILIIGEPQRSLDNIAFQLKMAMLAAAILITIVFQIVLKQDLARGAPDLAPQHLIGAKVAGGVSLVLWMGIISAGRLIAYAG